MNASSHVSLLNLLPTEYFSDLNYASVKARCQELEDYADLPCCCFGRFYNYKA